MIWHSRKTRELEAQLEQARQERRAVARKGQDREPMLQRLELRLAENSFADLLVASLHATRRRPT
jgi:hypothetical protein